MNTDARALPGRKESGQGGLPIGIGRDSSHGVVLRGLGRNRIQHRVHPCKVDRDLPDPGKAIHDLLPSQVTKIEMNIFSLKPPTLVYLRLNAPGYNVARAEFHDLGRIALHESLAIRVDEVASFPPGSLRDEDVRAVKAGGM